MNNIGEKESTGSPSLSSRIYGDTKEVRVMNEYRVRNVIKPLPFLPADPALAKIASSLYEDIQNDSVVLKGELPSD
jgi:hypothetical protein